MVNLTILKEQNAERGEQFARAFARARKDLVKISGRGEKQVIKFLGELRIDIDNRLKSFAGTPKQPFLSQIIPQIEGEIRLAIGEFTALASIEAANRIEEAFGLGSRVTTEAFRGAGVALAFPSISPEILSTLSAATGEILTDVSSALGDKIIKRIRASATGLEPSSLTMRKVEGLIKTSKEFIAGKRRRVGVAFQAEEIVRTETGRIFSNAQQAASEQIAQTIPNLRKQWLTVGGGRVRDGHRAAERRYTPGGESGPILINQRFQVSDFSRVGRSKFMTIGGKVRSPQGGGGLRVIRTDFTRRGRVTTDRMLFPRDPGARPGNVVNCLLPDNECVSGEFILGLKSFYSGPALVIETRRGTRLSLTANHPVITGFGWKPAKDISEGDYLLRDNSKIRRASFGRIGKQDNKNIPTFPEKIFNTLGAKGATRTIAISAGDFDGDSDWMENSKIQIVSPNAELLKNFYFPLTNPTSQRIFKSTPMSQPLKSCPSSLDDFRDTSLAPSGSIPGGTTNLLDGSAPSATLRTLPFLTHNFGSSTKWDSSFLECTNQGSPGNLEFLRKVQQGSAGEILFDEVVKIRKINFVGHVYDFQSTTGMMRCQDIYISNCRCVSVEVVPDIEKAVNQAKGVIQD